MNGNNCDERSTQVIIDTHLHLIDRSRLTYPWLSSAPALDRDWTLADYASQAHRLGVTSALHMEVDVAPRQIGDETAMVGEMMAGGLVVGAVSGARPERDDFSAWLDRLDRRVVRGLRRILHEVPDETSEQPAFRRGVIAAGAADLPFDLCLRGDQLPLGAGLADACPATAFVLDHCGNPLLTKADRAAWRKDLADLAGRPNVSVKISGLLAHTGMNWNPETLRPIVEHVIGCFGWDRVVWGSDSPLVNLGGSLADWVAVTRLLVEGCSQDERDALFHRNARRIWRL